jgi:diguanylate cyclase (GGDEF)-like protein/PAS domain S-box-containing protein
VKRLKSGSAIVVEANFGFVLHEQPRVTSVSKTVEALLGYTARDFLSLRVSLQDLIHAHDADIADRLFAPEISVDSRAVNLRIRHADGRIRCVRGTYRKEVERGGAVVLRLLLQDAKSLWKKPSGEPLPAYFRALMENTDDFIFFKDRNHVFTAASRTMTAALDIAAHGPSLLGQTDYDIFPEEYADLYYRLEKQVFAGSPVAGEVHESLSVDGRRLWLDNRKYPILDDSGEVIGLFGVVRDTTERIKAEQALRASEEELREAQSVAGVGSYLWDIQAGTWTSSNVLDEIFGIDKGYERTVAGWTNLLLPEDRPGMVAYLEEEVIGRSQPFNREYRIVRNNDRVERWVQGLGRLEFDAEGRPIVMHGTIQDITAQKLAERELRQSKELLQLLIENAPVSLSMFDREMRYLAVSRRARIDFAFGDREIFGHSHYEMLPWLPERYKKMHRRALAGETVRSSDDRTERPDGTVRWGRSEIQPWRTGDGSVGGIVLFTEDITERKLAETALRESKEFLELFIEHAPVALAMVDREMRLLSVSRRWLEDSGLAKHEIIGHSYYEVRPEIPVQWREADGRALAGEVVQVSEDRLQRPSGKVQWIRRDLRPWRTGDGAIGGITIFTEDITQRKEAEERLNLAASIIEQAEEGIVITDAGGSILETNEAFTRISGYTREEVLGKNPRILNSGRQSREFYAEMWRELIEKGLWSGEIWNRAKDGHVYAETLTISALRGEDGKTEKYIALFSDITSVKEQESKLELSVHYDLLTGLPNRALLSERLRQALVHAGKHGRRVAIAYLDIDNFKAFNDRHGRSYGDQILTAVARNMKLALRADDTLAHLGGDEFVAILPEIADTEGSWKVFTRLLQAASEPIEVGDFEAQMFVSAGVTFFPQTEEVDADLLLRQADQAMCLAKLEGKGRYHIFDPSLDRSIRDRHESLDRIRQGLAANEFVLYYQPKVNMCTGVVLGAEALIRWQHPESGLMSPGDFLPIISGHPLEIEIGNWVINSALSQMEQWLANGLDIPVSVNVSAEQLEQADFVNRLGILLAAHPTVAPSSFELEVLESSAISDATIVSEVIRSCKKLGVTFALDDFGTGYASLIYLKRLPMDVLKMDQTFVRDMLDNPEDLSVIEGMLAFGTAFRCQPLAEGVETVNHGLMLLRLGCQIAQGYFIARPMPASELPKWISTWRTDPQWENVRPFAVGDRPVLYARVEHGAWISAIDDFVNGKRQSAPVLDLNQCRFGAWLREEALVDGAVLPKRGGLLGFRGIDELHRQIHSLAVEILSLQGNGKFAVARVRLAELHSLWDGLFEKLNNLLQP